MPTCVPIIGKRVCCHYDGLRMKCHSLDLDPPFMNTLLTRPEQNRISFLSASQSKVQGTSSTVSHGRLLAKPILRPQPDLLSQKAWRWALNIEFYKIQMHSKILRPLLYHVKADTEFRQLIVYTIPRCCLIKGGTFIHRP